MRFNFLLTVFLLVALSAKAQLPPPCMPGQAPSEDCEITCIYCNFNGLVSSTTGYSSGSAPGFCGSIENSQWLGFIAGAPQATFTATPINCANGDGVQIALYDDCNGPPIDCNGGSMGNGGNPVSLIDVPLNPGSNYYLLIDGFGGDQCTFSITVNPPIAVIAPPIGNNIGPIQGPNPVCPGATVTYTIPPVANAGAYNWSVPSGWLINGMSSPQQVLAGDAGNSVQITFGTTSGAICVQAVNSCNLNGPSTCRSIVVAPIPPTTLPPATVCFEDTPYTLPWGDQAPMSGLYQTTINSYLGCDSVVRQQVNVKTPLLTFLTPKTICAGDFVTICDEPYSTGGSFAHMCESYQGCDSVVNFSIIVLDPVANINGGGTLTCNTIAVTLTASSSPVGTIFNWRNLAGQSLGNTNSLAVTAAGTYILSATLNGGGIQCIKRDTIVIGSNTIPPTLSATGGTLNCTVSSVALSASSNANPPAWAWSGPNGFTATIASPTATLLGTYAVTVTNGGNGCTSTATASVNGNTTPPIVSTVGATLSCAVTSTQITVQSTPGTVLFQWAGPNNFSSTLQSPTVVTPGNYTIIVTDTINNCTSSGAAIVNLDNTPPGANAATSGIISCTTPTVTINGGPGTAGNTFAWTGPNSFTSMIQNPAVTIAGTYTVLVTGANGCTSTTFTAVTGDTLAPIANASGGTVTCGAQNIAINGASSTMGSTFDWTGPGGFFSALQNPVVADSGLYVLTVTAPNACTATATALVLGDFELPDVSAVGGNVTCTETSVTITASSNTPGATLKWTGPGGFMSTMPSVTVGTVGNYIMTATAPNGCKDTAIAQVLPDANLPNASADGGELTCTDTSIILNGGTTSQGVLIAWQGPNGFNSTLEDPTVSVDGIYTLIVTNLSNGCTAEADATVTLNNTEPGASSLGGTLTCAQPNLNLSASAPTNTVTWMWTGPGGFNSSLQNPNIGVTGNYILTVTSTVNGCTTSSTAVVDVDQTAPQAASNTGTLTCSLDSLTLNGSANVAAGFQWSGPGGGGTGQNLLVVNPGDYTLIATATGNGCVDTLIVTVDQDIVPPGASASGDTIDCNNPQVPIAAGTTSGISYQWTGPGNFTSSLQNPVVDSSGVFTVTTTAANGCTSTAEAIVVLDNDPPTIVATANDIITCFAPSVNIQTTISPDSTLQGVLWTGPNNFSATAISPSITAGGTYSLVATGENGCTATANIVVQEDTNAPDANATGATLTCTNITVVLNGTSQTLGTTFDWSGPNGFSSMLEDPSASFDGTYTVTVTAQNGCTSSAQAIISIDTLPPSAAAVGANNLNCDDLNAVLAGSSQTIGVTYLWSGPNNFNATTALISASLPGIYQVQVTGPNGCTASSSLTLTQDISAPNATALGGTVDCISGQLSLSGNSTTTNASFAWTGPNNFNAAQQNPVVSSPGDYVLTVTGPNGCSNIATATVVENTSSPIVSLAGATPLTCQVTAITLTSTISTMGATGVWTGPNSFTASTENITISTPGTYVYTVTAQNGCISAPTLNIIQNITPPQGVSATGGLLNCSFPSISLQGNSSTPGVNYAWTGPGNFMSSLQNPAVNMPGIYTLVVSNPINGCTTAATTNVTQDPTVPDISVQADSLTCATTSVILNASTMTAGVTFLWTGPNNFSSTVEDPQTSTPGLYAVVATALSGCTAVSNFIVKQNINLPNVMASGDTLTCTQQSGQINSSSSTLGVNFAWTGPGNFSSNLASPSITLAGTYTVVVTAPNGCSSSAQAIVSPDVNAPVITASGGTITCLVTSVTLGATSNIGVLWSWTGPANFSSNVQNPAVTAAGNYTLSATAPNGCVSTKAAVVLANTIPPNLSTSIPNELDCTTTQVGLGASVVGAGQYSYLWNTQNGVILSGANTATPQVTQAGVYSVQATDLSNGCTITRNVTVMVDPATPSGAVLQKKDITCYGETDGSIRIDSIQGGTAPFLYSLDNQAFTTSFVYQSLTPGNHILVVQDANGCEYATTFNIGEPEELIVNLGPDTTIHLGQRIILTLNNITNYPDRVVETLVTPSTLLLPDTLEPTYSFRYQVEVVDSNGCKAKDERNILVDRERWVYIPNVFNPNSADNGLLMVFGGEDVARVKSFLVFDRWGNAIHEYRDFLPNDPAAGWNGTYKGNALNPAVFVYFAEILFKDGELEVFKGDVSLIR